MKKLGVVTFLTFSICALCLSAKAQTTSETVSLSEGEVHVSPTDSSHHVVILDAVQRMQVAQNSVNPASRPAPRASLGVRIVAHNSAVVVFDVQSGSAAERAGLMNGDTILSLNGAKVTTPATFSDQIAKMQPGTEITLTILRDGRTQSIRATLAPPTSAAANIAPGGPNKPQSVTFQGIKPGYNRRPDVEKALGQPVQNISATRVEYKASAGIERIQIDYTGSEVVDRIMVTLAKPVLRSSLIQKLKLPGLGIARKTSPEGKLVEFFGPPALVAFTYASSNESDGVVTISYYDIAREYQDAIALDPKDVGLHGRLATLYLNQKRYDEAIAEHQAWSRLDPNAAFPHYNLGIVYYDQKRYDEAIAEYQQAIRLDPANSALFHNNLANTYATQKRYPEATAEYQQAIKLDPKNVLAYFNLGITYANSGNKAAAMEQYSALQRLDPARSKQLLDYINKH